MITTVIPFLLVANLSDHLKWKNGPEFRYQFNVTVIMDGFNGDTEARVMNVINHLICRPKECNILSCEFDHENLNVTTHNKVTSETLVNPMIGHEAVLFEIKFNRLGVESLIIPRCTPENFTILLKSVANLLHTGIDLAAFNYSLPNDEKIVSDEMVYFLTGMCMADVVSIYAESLKFEQHRLDLNLIDPLKKLTCDKTFFVLEKSINASDCIESPRFPWSKLLLKDLHYDDDIKIIKYINHMYIYMDVFESGTYIRSKKMINGDEIVISETISNRLVEIRPSRRKIPNVNDPIRIIH